MNVQFVLGFLPCKSAGLSTGTEPEINLWLTNSPPVSSYTTNPPGIVWVLWWVAPCQLPDESLETWNMFQSNAEHHESISLRKLSAEEANNLLTIIWSLERERIKE